MYTRPAKLFPHFLFARLFLLFYVYRIRVLINVFLKMPLVFIQQKSFPQYICFVCHTITSRFKNMIQEHLDVNKIKIVVDIIEAFSIKICNDFFLTYSLLQIFDNLEHRSQHVNNEINPIRIEIKKEFR